MAPISVTAQYADPLLSRFFMSDEEVSQLNVGLQIVKAFYDRQTTNDDSLNYFRRRNARWIEMLLWFKGQQRMAEFLDFLNVADANKSFINVDTEQTRVAPQLVGTLIESMAKSTTYACVEATDVESEDAKKKMLQDALFRMHEIETIKAAQEHSGLELEPPGAFVPNSYEAAVVHFELEDKLPKEIRLEKVIKGVQDEISFDRVANRKTLFYLSAVNLTAGRIEKQAGGRYTVRIAVPTNLIYDFFMNDCGDYEVKKIGEFYNMKVSEFRARFGVSAENPNGLPERKIFDLARMTGMRNVGTFNYAWNYQWSETLYNANRPYDDASILVLDCSIFVGTDQYYVSKKDSYGRENITKKKGVPYQSIDRNGYPVAQDKPEDVEIIKTQKARWMRGIYAPYGATMCYWGEDDYQIQEFYAPGRVLCPWTVVVPNNDGDYVPSLLERLIEPLREYQVTKMKRKVLIAQVRNAGFTIDVESARNIDLGNGDTIEWDEVLRIFLNTGIQVYSSKGVDPLQREAPPLAAPPPDESIQKIIGLTEVIQECLKEMRELVGVPPYRDGSQVGDRTANALAENQNAASYNVTDFIINYNNEFWEKVWYKMCLLHWQDFVREEPESSDDMINFRFRVGVKIKSSEYERQLMEADIQRYSQALDANGKPLLSPKDAMMLRQIDNYKLRCMYLDAVVEENRQRAIQDSQRLQAQNAQVQQAAADKNAQNEMQLEAQKDQRAGQIKRDELTGKKELEIINGIFLVASRTPTGDLPVWLQPLAQAAIANVMMPIVAENQQMQQGLQMVGQAQMNMQQMAQNGGTPPGTVPQLPPPNGQGQPQLPPPQPQMQ
ncbi:MAG: hypothetical protein C5B59_07950 [Bacteroidetes bacterium]|nr:MAG: hypothetical protein C5B59_07950 [Bacteroidota bacterium]